MIRNDFQASALAHELVLISILNKSYVCGSVREQ